MGSKQGWRRYRPPSQRRTESGDPIPAGPGTAGTKGRPRRSSARPKPKRPTASNSGKPAGSTGRGWVGGLVALAVLAGIVGIVIAARGGDGGDDSSEIDRELLTEEFIASSLDRAVAEEGAQAVSVRVTEYGVTVEYFDPNARESRYFETNSYTDGYELRVEETHYDTYQPRPFDITVLDPARIVAAVEDALDRADDPYTFTLRASADQETGEVSMVTSVGGDESIDVTQAP